MDPNEITILPNTEHIDATPLVENLRAQLNQLIWQTIIKDLESGELEVEGLTVTALEAVELIRTDPAEALEYEDISDAYDWYWDAAWAQIRAEV